MIARRFLHENIEGGAGNVSAAESLVEGLLVDDAAAGDVEDAGAAFHESELRRADQVARLVGKRRVDGEEITAWQQLVESRDTLDAELARTFGRHERVVADNLHVQS